MSYAEAPDHPDLKWMHTLEQQQQGLGAANMDYYYREKAAGLWAQKGLLKENVMAKKLALRRRLALDKRNRMRRKYYSRIAPPPPIQIPSPKNPVPGISPNAVVAVGDLERKKAAVLKGKVRKITQLVAAQANLAKRLKKVPDLTQASLYNRRPVNLPQPTWNYLSTQGIITPGGMITPMGAYVEAGPSEAFGGFGVTPVFNTQAFLSLQATNAQNAATRASQGVSNKPLAIYNTPALQGSTLTQKIASSVAQASVIAKDCSHYMAEAEALERKASAADCNWSDPACYVKKAAAKGARAKATQICGEEALARAKANFAMSQSYKKNTDRTKRTTPRITPRVKVANIIPPKVTVRLPDNRLINTAGGTIVTETGSSPGSSGPQAPTVYPPAEEGMSKVPLYLGLAALVAGGAFYVSKRKKA